MTVSRETSDAFYRIAAGDVVLVGEDMPFWAGCLVHVEEVKAWGVRGAVYGPQKAEYPIRVAHESIVTVFRRITDDREQ